MNKLSMLPNTKQKTENCKPKTENQNQMTSNYFKTTWRHLVKNKFHTAINITGLVIGFTISIAILLMVYHQLDFDKFHVNNSRLFQAYQLFNKQTGPEYAAGFGFPAAPVYKAEAPAIERSSGFLYGGNNAVYRDKELDVPVMLVDEDFLRTHQL